MSNYSEYLHADVCIPFGEWLIGKRLPQFERRETGFLSGKYEYRMYRRSRCYWDSYHDVQGEWCATMKAAKASYKEALRKSKQEAAQ
ncbi:TPA: hypothetical protein ACIBOM_000728 [Salmonella enterica subsp. enterica serovar Reading]